MSLGHRGSRGIGDAVSVRGEGFVWFYKGGGGSGVMHLFLEILPCSRFEKQRLQT